VVQGGSAMIFLFMEEKNSERERERYNFLSTSYCPSTFCPLAFREENPAEELLYQIQNLQ
jgi:hypothetical protein